MLLPLLLNLDLIVHGHRRRGKRVRYQKILRDIERESIDVVSDRYAQAVIDQARELSRLRAEYDKANALSGSVRLVRLAEIENNLIQAEETLAVLQDEEALVLIIAMAV